MRTRLRPDSNPSFGRGYVVECPRHGTIREKNIVSARALEAAHSMCEGAR